MQHDEHEHDAHGEGQEGRVAPNQKVSVQRGECIEKGKARDEECLEDFGAVGRAAVSSKQC